MAGPAKRSVAVLAAKFVVLAPLCLVGWLLVLPVYARILAYSAGSVLRYALKYDITAIKVAVAGILNTGTAITYTVSGYATTMPDLGHLVGNVAPFVALVLATPRIRLRRRLGVLGIGIGLIYLSHLATVVIRFASHGPMASRTPLSTTIGFVSITLPFLLWIVLAYWGELMGFLGEEPMKREMQNAECKTGEARNAEGATRNTK